MPISGAMHRKNLFEGHQQATTCLAWSRNGRFLASGSQDESLHVWDVENDRLHRKYVGFHSPIFDAAWSKDGKHIATASGDDRLRIWNLERDQVVLEFDVGSSLRTVHWSTNSNMIAYNCGHGSNVQIWDLDQDTWISTYTRHRKKLNQVRWCRDDEHLASCSSDGQVHVWSVRERQDASSVFVGHTSSANCVAWSPSQMVLASGSTDRTVRIWDPDLGVMIAQLEGHKSRITDVAFSPEGRFLLSRSVDGVLNIWRCDSWELVGSSDTDAEWHPGQVEFHPYDAYVATNVRGGNRVRIYAIDYDGLFGTTPPRVMRRYRNAKVLLVGDSGAGKTGLGLVLSGQEFKPVESTHGRFVWEFDSDVIELPGNRTEHREILLWDLAGQPAYRFIHRLHLHDVAIAVVVFTVRSESDEFAGVEYWSKAIDQATVGFPTRKLLVAARIDVGGGGGIRVAEIVERLGFEGYLETSAKYGDGIETLAKSIRDFVRWEQIPFVTTPEVFAAIKGFLIDEKRSGRVLPTFSELYKRYSLIVGARVDEGEFRTCLSMLEASGAIRQLSFEDLVLLQPEVLDNYVAALAMKARSKPDGLGYFSKLEALEGDFHIDEKVRIPNKKQEDSMLLATISEVVGRGVAVRQITEDGEMLVFPSEFRNDIPEQISKRSIAVRFKFEGSVSAAYAALTVNLIHSAPFVKRSLHSKAAVFAHVDEPDGEDFGYIVEFRERGNESLGLLSVFFGNVDESHKLLFLRFVNLQLEKHALQGSVVRERVYQCDEHPLEVSREAVEMATMRGRSSVRCSLCGKEIQIDDLVEKAGMEDSQVLRVQELAEEIREKEQRLTVRSRREELGEYHALLCFNETDLDQADRIRDGLRDQGIVVWEDRDGWFIEEGALDQLQSVHERTPCAILLLGPRPPEQTMQLRYETMLRRFADQREGADRPLRLIPVLLPGHPAHYIMPPFARIESPIDYRYSDHGLQDDHVMRTLVRSILRD